MTKQDKADITYERVAAVLQQLRDSGGRATTAAWSLIEALVAAEDRRRSLTAEELADAVHRSHPLVNDSTIYRILDRLEKADLVEHVHLGHGRAVYHLADEPHLHLVCERCGTETRTGALTLEAIRRELIAAAGFHSSPHHFAIPGLCKACAKAKKIEDPKKPRLTRLTVGLVPTPSAHTSWNSDCEIGNLAVASRQPSLSADREHRGASVVTAAKGRAEEGWKSSVATGEGVAGPTTRPGASR